MSDREFMKVFSGVLGALVLLTVLFFILANMVVSGSNLNASKQAQSEKAIAERIKPVGEIATGPSGNAVMNSIIPPANAQPAGAADGQKIYQQTCAACHAAGVAGAPKTGDKAAWKARLAQGNDTLYKHAIAGFQGKTGFMPPKGGNASLTDAQVKAAVDYMVKQSK